MEYGIDPRNLDMVAYAEEYKFIDGGKKHSSQFIHNAVMDMNYYNSPGYCKLRSATYNPLIVI